MFLDIIYVIQFTGKSLCRQFQPNRNSTSSDHQILLRNLYNYARENLALVNIYIKEPVVTRILRDQRIPVIWFVANCGGILGLCMGFSIVTVFEVLHCLVKTTFSSLESWYYKVSPLSIFYFRLRVPAMETTPLMIKTGYK